MKCYTKRNKVYEFDENDPAYICRIGYFKYVFGKIYLINSDIAALIFEEDEKSVSPERMDDIGRVSAIEVKIQAMIDLSEQRNTEFLAWPKEMLYDESGLFQGYTIPYIYGSLLNDACCDQNLSWKKKVKLAANLSAAVKNIHEMGHMAGIGCIENTIYDNGGNLILIACCLCQITHPKNKKMVQVCGSLIQNFLCAPELLPKEFTYEEFMRSISMKYTKEADYYTLAIVIYLLLSYNTHPFDPLSVIKFGSADSDWNSDWDRVGDIGYIMKQIRNGKCLLFPETYMDANKVCEIYNLEKSVIPYYPRRFKLNINEVFPPDICDLFKRTFLDGHKDPKKRATAEEWHLALSDLLENLKHCEHNQMHYYHNSFEECPLCLNERRITENMDPPPLQKTKPQVNKTKQPSRSLLDSIKSMFKS